MLQQHERQKAHDLGLGLEEPQQEPAEADRLAAELGAGGVVAGRIALVEDEVDHWRHSREPLGPLHAAAPSATTRLARVIRCSMAASLTRKARAICFTERPQTMRSAREICWVAG